jgi:ferredoxin/flavodoxin---NADP+ reductase
MTAETLNIAVVGSGPSGFYAAEALFQGVEDVSVDMYERLPTPFGLVRSGVAPDHPKLKDVAAVYSRLMQDPRFIFFGNVEVGRTVELARLTSAYDAVILAYGAASDRKLGVPGEELAGCHSATQFVGWYNGHPDYRDLDFDLSHETAVVVGQGNVAADVARILLQSVENLASTDIAAHALAALRKSRVRAVHLVGRRGPAQAKFTTKELRGLTSIRDCAVDVEAAPLTDSCRLELADRGNVNAAKNVELLGGAAAPQDASRHLAFRFLLEPEAVVGSGRVERIVFRRTQLEGLPFAQRAKATHEHVALECGLVLTSIGYRGEPMDGIPFDIARGVVPNDRGLVLAEGDQTPSLYVTGWLKRGPTGIIGTNRADSIETVQRLLANVRGKTRKPAGARRSLHASLLDAIVVDVEGWTRVDEAERFAGARAGKPREKFVRVAAMLACLDDVGSSATGARKAFGTGPATERQVVGM